MRWFPEHPQPKVICLLATQVQQCIDRLHGLSESIHR